jgi:hypothetical protein
MKPAISRSWGYDRRDLPAEDLASIRAAAICDRKEHRHSSNRSRMRLRGDFGQLVGVRP